MEEELSQLRDLVAQLQAENRKMRQERDADQPVATASTSSASGQSSVQVPVSERLIYLPRDRKCPMFRGTTGLNIVEWIEEVQACTRARYLSPSEQALFMYDHLDGEAREEIKYRSREEREDPAKILTILQELYGCSRSYVSLQEYFFSRKQQEGETLQEFSRALLCLMDKVIKKAPNGLVNEKVLLRDQFVEYVSDCSLRRELKQFVRDHPTATLVDVRSEAIRWEREGMPGGGRGRSYSVPSAIGFQHTVQGGHFADVKASNSSVSSELSELKEILRNQQEQLTQLTKTFATFSNATKTYREGVICRRCQQPGHYAKECRGKYVAPGPQPAWVAARSTSNRRDCPQNQGNSHPLNC